MESANTASRGAMPCRVTVIQGGSDPYEIQSLRFLPGTGGALRRFLRREHAPALLRQLREWLLRQSWECLLHTRSERPQRSAGTDWSDGSHGPDRISWPDRPDGTDGPHGYPRRKRLDRSDWSCGSNRSCWSCRCNRSYGSQGGNRCARSCRPDRPRWSCRCDGSDGSQGGNRCARSCW